jgi:thioredoxin-like negative regulator of GroEL
MGVVENGKRADMSESADEPSRSSASPLLPELGEEPDLVEQYRQAAARLLREGQPARAFGELVRASRILPMTPHLASALVCYSLRAGTEAAAIALLTNSIGSTHGVTRRAVRRQLARVLRRVNQMPRALETLHSILAESPNDRRARQLIELLTHEAASSDGPAPAKAPVADEADVTSAVPGIQDDTWSDAIQTLSSQPQQGPEEEERPAPPPVAVEAPRSEPREVAAPASPPIEAVVPEAVSSPPPPEPSVTAPPRDAVASPQVATPPEAEEPSRLVAAEPSAPEAPPAAPAQEAAASPASAAPPVPEQSPAPAPQEAVAAREPVHAEQKPAVPEPRKQALGVSDSWLDVVAAVEAETGKPEPEAETAGASDDRRETQEVPAFQSKGEAPSKDEGVQNPLDAAVQRAKNPAARAAAYLHRAEQFLANGALAKARADFGAAESLSPGSLQALTGIARCVAEVERPAAAERLRAALAVAPPRTPYRLEGLRCLAELAEGPLHNPRLAQWAWTEVLVEDPEAPKAAGQLLVLARKLRDRKALIQVLESRLDKAPHGGPEARETRLELVAALESEGHEEAALTELREAIATDPAHKEARLLLVERLVALGQIDEAARALRDAAPAPEEDAERQRTWERLSRFCREVLGDQVRAQVYANWAENLRVAMAGRTSLTPAAELSRSILSYEAGGTRPAAPRAGVKITAAPAIPPPPDAAPTQVEFPAVAPGTPPAPPEAVTAPAPVAPSPKPAPVRPSEPARLVEPARPAEPAAVPARFIEPARASKPASKPPPAIDDAAMAQLSAPEPPAAHVPVEGTQVIGWYAPPGKLDPRGRKARPPGSAPAAPGSENTNVRAIPAPPAPGSENTNVRALQVPPQPPAPAQAEARPAAFERVRQQPLDAQAYREIAAFFASRGDTARSTLMAEVSEGLKGQEGPSPSPLRRTLTPEERAGLRHPGLRNPSGELLASVGLALCRLFPVYGRAAGSNELLRPDTGPGARAALDALQVSARILDLPVPEVFLSEEDGPPFTLVHASAPRLLVGRFAVRRVHPEPELRFFAGRALACLGPDLLALRCLKKDQLLRAVAILASVLNGGSDFGPEARVVRDSLHPAARERAQSLLEKAQQEFDPTALADAARHSANRAGLVTCGGVGAALMVLRNLKTSDQDLVELVRFAASERYLPLRG